MSILSEADPFTRLLVVSNVIDSVEAAVKGDGPMAESRMRAAIALDGYVTIGLMHGMLMHLVHNVAQVADIGPEDVIDTLRQNAAEYC